MDYEFFLSYARVNRNVYLERFFADLATAVRAKVPLAGSVEVDEVGFFDRNAIGVGESWDDRLISGLTSARTLVPVLTVAYPQSEGCGKELAVFLDRVRRAQPGAPLILPIMWEKPRDVLLPQALERAQWNEADLGDAYAERGLAYLARRSPHEPAYLDFVEEFATRLVAAARNPPPAPAAAPRWDAVRSAFTGIGPGSGVTGVVDDQLPVARCAFLAARPDEFAGLRTDVTAYRGQADAWRPFVPDTTAVRLLAQAVATREQLAFETFPVDERLADRVRDAERDGELVIVVIDPWTVQLAAYREHLTPLDQGQFVNFGVLAPLNSQDAETTGRLDVLRGHVRQAMSRTFVVNPAYIRDAIHTPEEFEREFVAAIGDARRRMAQLREVRSWAGADHRPMPAVSGPVS